MTDAYNKVASFVSDTVSKIQNNSIVSAATTKFESLRSTIASKLSAAYDKVVEAFNNMKKKILILDDSTSAVDTRTDALIRKAFREFIPETTKIIIAQRVSSVQDADKIIIMDKGQIMAVGTHEELLASNEIYQEVYTSQNKGGDDDAE